MTTGNIKGETKYRTRDIHNLDGFGRGWKNNILQTVF